METRKFRIIALICLCFGIAIACSGGKKGDEKKDDAVDGETGENSDDGETGEFPEDTNDYITKDLDGNIIEKCYADYAEEIEKTEDGEQVMICDCQGDDCKSSNSTGTNYEANVSGTVNYLSALDFSALRKVYATIDRWRRDEGVPRITRSQRMGRITREAGYVRSHSDHARQDRQIRGLPYYRRRWGAILAVTPNSNDPAKIWKDYKDRTGHYRAATNRAFTHIGCSAYKRGPYYSIWCSLLG